MDEQLKELLKRIQKPDEFMSLADRQRLINLVYEMQGRINFLREALKKGAK